MLDDVDGVALTMLPAEQLVETFRTLAGGNSISTEVRLSLGANKFPVWL